MLGEVTSDVLSPDVREVTYPVLLCNVRDAGFCEVALLSTGGGNWSAGGDCPFPHAFYLFSFEVGGWHYFLSFRCQDEVSVCRPSSGTDSLVLNPPSACVFFSQSSLVAAEESERPAGPREAQVVAVMRGGRQQQDRDQLDPSFLNSGNGPSISVAGAKGGNSRLQNMASAIPAPASPRNGAVSGAPMADGYTEYNDGTTTDVLGDRSPAVGGRSYGPRPGTERPDVSFHVNPDFDNEANTNSDVLLQGYEAHNRIPNWPQPQQGQPYAVRSLPLSFLLVYA